MNITKRECRQCYKLNCLFRGNCCANYKITVLQRYRKHKVRFEIPMLMFLQFLFHCSTVLNEAQFSENMESEIRIPP
jgi:hypothetical protein